MTYLIDRLKEAFRHPFKIPRMFKREWSAFYKLHILKDEHTVITAKWYRDRGDETLRLNYPLNAESIVFDLGGYKGDFAADIYDKFQCRVYLYEPVERFYLECVQRFQNNPKITCLNYGLSNETGSFFISDEDNGSSLIKNNAVSQCEKVFVKSFSQELIDLEIDRIDLLKINVEGAEFPILKHVLEKNLTAKVDHFQIQFHSFFPDAISERNAIRKGLSKTHDEVWNYPFVWESWSLRN